MAPAVKIVGFILIISFSLSNADFAQLFKELYQKAQQSNTPVVVLLDKTGQSSNLNYQPKQQKNWYRGHGLSSLGGLKYNLKHSLINSRTNAENRYESNNLRPFKDRQRNKYEYNYDRYQRSDERYRNYETDERYDHRDRYERHERFNRQDQNSRNDKYDSVKMDAGYDSFLDSLNRNKAYRLHNNRYYDSYERNDRYYNPKDRYQGSPYEKWNDQYSQINRYYKDIARTGKNEVKNVLRLLEVEHCDKDECNFTDEKDTEMTTEGIISIEQAR